MRVINSMFRFDPFINNTAIISSDGRQMTYGELDRLSKNIAQGVEKHQLVFCLCRNTIETVAAYVGFVNNDDAVLLLDAHISKASLKRLTEVYKPRYIYNNNLEVIIENWTPVADNLAVLLATSGSTGSPKMVRLSNENLQANAMSIIEFLHLNEQERPILGLPMNYAYGLSIINSHLMAGATLLLTEASFVEREFFQFANANGFTSFSSVPFAYETIRRMGIWKQEMPTLRTLTQSGGLQNKDTVRFFVEKFSPNGVKFYAMYGQAEATARISYLEPDCILEKLGSIGKAIPGGKLSLEDGELVYEGSNVSLGYAECAADLLKGDENKGVIHTGDMAYCDSDGCYYIIGRKNRFVKLFGHRISLDHVEQLLQSYHGEYACVGDDTHLVVFTTDADCDEQKVADDLASMTMLPRKTFCVRRIERMPRSEAGKILYKELNDKWNIK